jgi:Adenylosuccinate synthetase
MRRQLAVTLRAAASWHRKLQTGCRHIFGLWHAADTVYYINEAFDSGKRILIEGANATMLDIDFGTYPYVTSSNPSIGGLIAGLGLAPNKLEAVIGVVSPSELSDTFVYVYACVHSGPVEFNPRTLWQSNV